MKIKNAGYIKLHRKFLNSHICKLRDYTVLLFIKLLLAADRSGQIEASLEELKEGLGLGSKTAILNAIKTLEKENVISVQRKPGLKLSIINWERYQAYSSGPQNGPTTVHDMDRQRSTIWTDTVHDMDRGNIEHNRVPVQLTKEYKNIFKNSETAKKQNSKILNFLEPQTDLEKLIRFYLQLTNHPALNKPNANDLLNVALKNDIPNFEMVLANCTNVTQAAKCVREFVQSAEGTYNLFYLPRQIDSIRQKVEERERREMIERRRKNAEDREYMRILADKEQWAREHGDDAGC